MRLNVSIEKLRNQFASLQSVANHKFEIAVVCFVILVQLGVDSNNLFVVLEYYFMHGFCPLTDFENYFSFVVIKAKQFEVQDVVAENLCALDIAAFSHNVFFHFLFMLLLCSL